MFSTDPNLPAAPAPQNLSFVVTEAEFRQVGRMIGRVLDGLAGANSPEGNAEVEAAVAADVQELCPRFPTS